MLGAGAWLSGHPDWADICWALVAIGMLIAVVVSLVQMLVRRELGVDLIAAIALGGSLALGEYLTGAIIGLMYATGQMLEDLARQRADQTLSALIDRAPRIAHRVTGSDIIDVDVSEVKRGDAIVVKAGEIVPVDGLLAASTVLDESALTGEAALVERGTGERVASGVVNAGAPFEFTATAPAQESTYAGIVRLATSARAAKAPFARMADRYALIFVPVALVVAGLAWLLSGDVNRALAVVVVATPCPLILAVPTAIVSGISAAARRGIVVKDGAALEQLASAEVLMFDKTGTLTTGQSRVSRIVAVPSLSQSDVLRYAASLEQTSAHVIAESLVTAARSRDLPLFLPTHINERPGTGIAGVVNGRHLRVGSAKWIQELGADIPDGVLATANDAATIGASLVFVSSDNEFAGLIILTDEIRSDAPRTLRKLREAGISRILMVTGDRADVADSVGLILGVDEVVSECSADQKIAVVTSLSGSRTVVMVGDGINDAPALAAASVGVAMGARGATASAESADVVLLVDRVDRLVEAIHISRRTRMLATQSAVAGMGLSFVAMGLAAFGLLVPVVGAFVQEAIDIAVILNSLRALRQPGSGLGTGKPSNEFMEQLTSEHRQLDPIIDEIGRVADQIVTMPDQIALQAVTDIDEKLETEIIPHEKRDEMTLHPKLSLVLGGFDPMAPLSAGHREIFRITSLIRSELQSGRLATGDAAAKREVQRLLYSLEDLLRLHFTQEEEI